MNRAGISLTISGGWFDCILGHFSFYHRRFDGMDVLLDVDTALLLASEDGMDVLLDVDTALLLAAEDGMDVLLDVDTALPFATEDVLLLLRSILLLDFPA